jgi:hypothetical protein
MSDAEDLSKAPAEEAANLAGAPGEGGIAAETSGAPSPAAASVHPPEELLRALGYGPMTGGKPSGIVAITPPNQYPRSVWDALVAQGKLKKGSQGQYELVKH